MWRVQSRIVAEPISATVSGTRSMGGAVIHLDVKFRTDGWPSEYGDVSLIPQPGEVRAQMHGEDIHLGFALPDPNRVMLPRDYSSSEHIRFSLSVVRSTLAALETMRDGANMQLSLGLTAHPFLAPRPPNHTPGIDVRPTGGSYSFRVPKEDWLATLRNVGHCETLVTELALPSSGPESTKRGRERLMQAVKAHDEGSYAESMRRCRIALDELKNSGFGGKAPKDVAAFLQEKAATLSSPERLSALQLALQVFLSPSHHANAPDEHYLRVDAELAIVMTAALMRLAPTYCLDEPTSTMDDEATH